MKEMKLRFSAPIILFLSLLLSATSNANIDIKSSVVLIEVVMQKPDYNDPWKMKSEIYKYGSGCIIDGGRILTNAHIVADQKHIRVQKAGDIEKYTAEVEFVGHDCDLALLKVKNPEFFKGVFPIKLGGIPAEGDQVTAYGFPVGGNKISITQGVVSRIEMQRYGHSGYTYIAVQIDAALNHGNSGGPVLKGDRLSGIAFGVVPSSEKTGYIIPIPVIKRFLMDIRDGRYDGFPSVKCGFQSIENNAMNSILKLKDNKHGVCITSIEFGNTLWNVLQEGDILLSLDGVPIAKDGTIDFVNNDRIDFGHLMCRHQIGDKVELVFLRNGEMHKKRVRLQAEKRLVALPQYDLKPSYYIFSGLLFMPLTSDYIDTWGEEYPPVELLYHYVHGKLKDGQSQVVLLIKVMAHEVNQGYDSMSNLIIRSVNGKSIGRMADLPSAFSRPLGVFHVIEFENGYKIILDASEVEKAHTEILNKYNISRDRSEDMQ